MPVVAQCGRTQTYFVAVSIWCMAASAWAQSGKPNLTGEWRLGRLIGGT